VFKIFIGMFLGKLSVNLHKAGNKCQSLKRKYFPGSLMEANVSQWFADKGDQTLRLNYDLTPHSVVVDVGGYVGQWTSDIFSMYVCTIHVFEPVDEFALHIRERFSKNPKISVYSVGLASSERTAEISLRADASSVFRSSSSQTQIRLVDAVRFFEEHDIHHIDLIKINIEGGEYELLEQLLNTGFIKNIDNIQVQFHEFIDGHAERMAQIQKSLSRTHSLTYQYPMVWENWRRNP